MPSILLHPQSAQRATRSLDSPLPELLQTPSGLAIVEVQGTIHAPIADPASHGRSAEAVQVGKLVFPLYDSTKPLDDLAWMKRVYMYVGKHQRLTGEVKTLPNPVAIIRRREGGSTVDTSSAVAGADELEIVGIVRYKVLFAHRPEPVGGQGQ